MTSSLEKLFFNYTLRNKNFFEVVKPYFFKNAEIQFVYGVVRDYMLKNPDASIPSPRQILDMVTLEDKDGLITKDLLKSILSVNFAEYDEKNFTEPKFQTWVLANRIKTGAVDIIDETRNFDDILDFESAIESANKIRSIVDEYTSLSFVEDDDIGSDFDDPENHVQDLSRLKVKTGFETIDHMLGGGWDVNTLNIIMAETNQGKSIWMQNFSVKAADMGYNVLYITLEMSEKKVLKRLGAMRLRVPINEYDKVSKDVESMRRRIAQMGSLKEGADLFQKKSGKIVAKFWAAGTATVVDFDSYIQKIGQRKGIKFDLIVVDYITLVAPVKGVGGDSLYIKGKHLAEGLRAIAAKYKCPVITAVQVSKDSWGASDISLSGVPESKAIAETADTFFTIIRTEEMKRQNLYRFKLLKQRDGDFLRSQIKINLNPVFLTLENDLFIDSVQ